MPSSQRVEKAIANICKINNDNAKSMITYLLAVMIEEAKFL